MVVAGIDGSGLKLRDRAYVGPGFELRLRLSFFLSPHPFEL